MISEFCTGHGIGQLRRQKVERRKEFFKSIPEGGDGVNSVQNEGYDQGFSQEERFTFFGGQRGDLRRIKLMAITSVIDER